MFGIASISQFQKRVDLFDKADWEAAASFSQIARLAEARNPIHKGLNGFPFSPVGIWGFEPKKSIVRIISGELRGTAVGIANKRDSGRARLDLFASLAPFLLRTASLKPPIEQFCDIVRTNPHRSEFSHLNYSKFLDHIVERCVLEWIDVKDMSVALLVERNKVRTSDKTGESFLPNTNAILNHIAGLVHDYHAFRLPIWRSAPPVSLAESLPNTNWLRNVFADPLSFDPADPERPDCFLWPWQRCLTATAWPNPVVHYRRINTTSLVLDIRASTSAMELTDFPDKFSEFIDSIVSVARKTILAYGGYFDKETGDGVAGHFCDGQSVPKSAIKNPEESMEILAVKAGQEIAKKVQDLCLGYQRWLRHGMDKLGPAVGIHSGAAVWLADENQIRAIGTSVVGAARLCAAADAGEIVISNQTFHSVGFSNESIDGLLFQKKNVALKEHGDRIGTYAYAARAIA